MSKKKVVVKTKSAPTDKQQTKQRKRPAHLYKPGQSGNPAGRQKGSRNKLGEAFLKDFLEVWEKEGKGALLDARAKDPAAFIRVAASILPKELNINHDSSALEKILEQFSIDELDQLIAGLTTLGAHELSDAPKNQKAARGKSDSVH